MEEINTMEKIHENFVNELISLGMTQEKALEVSTTFFLAWVKSKGTNPDVVEYEKDVKAFVSKLQEKS